MILWYYDSMMHDAVTVSTFHLLLPTTGTMVTKVWHFYEWFSIKFSFYDSIFLLKLRMLKSCRICSLFFGIYVKLLILKKLYFNLLITLSSRSGQLIVRRSGHCPVQMPRSGHKNLLRFGRPDQGTKTCPGVSKRCPDQGTKTSPS